LLRILHQKILTLVTRLIKSEPEEECLWELTPLVTSIDKLDFNNTANDEGEWFINEDLDLAYFSTLAS